MVQMHDGSSGRRGVATGAQLPAGTTVPPFSSQTHLLATFEKAGPAFPSLRQQTPTFTNGHSRSGGKMGRAETSDHATAERQRTDREKAGYRAMMMWAAGGGRRGLGSCTRSEGLNLSSRRKGQFRLPSYLKRSRLRTDFQSRNSLRR
jgi:hypothetical protein